MHFYQLFILSSFFLYLYNLSHGCLPIFTTNCIISTRPYLCRLLSSWCGLSLRVSIYFPHHYIAIFHEKAYSLLSWLPGFSLPLGIFFIIWLFHLKRSNVFKRQQRVHSTGFPLLYRTDKFKGCQINVYFFMNKE